MGILGSVLWLGIFVCQAEDGIRDLVRSRGLGDVYKRQGGYCLTSARDPGSGAPRATRGTAPETRCQPRHRDCLLYTSDAADERSSVDLGGRRIIKKKKSDAQARKQCINANTTRGLRSERKR